MAHAETGNWDLKWCVGNKKEGGVLLDGGRVREGSEWNDRPADGRGMQVLMGQRPGEIKVCRLAFFMI